MGLFKSPAGISWAVGIPRLVEQETTVYVDRLVSEWMDDAERRMWAEQQSWSNDPAAALRLLTLALYNRANDQVLQQSGRAGHNIRQIAALDAKTYQSLRKLTLDKWSSA